MTTRTAIESHVRATCRPLLCAVIAWWAQAAGPRYSAHRWDRVDLALGLEHALVLDVGYTVEEREEFMQALPTPDTATVPITEACELFFLEVEDAPPHQLCYSRSVIHRMRWVQAKD